MYLPKVLFLYIAQNMGMLVVRSVHAAGKLPLVPYAGIYSIRHRFT